MSQSELRAAIPLPTRSVPADAWLRWACWAVVMLCAIQVALFSFGRDQSIYAQVASTILDGGMPYRDAWDFKPPGIFLLYALAEATFGHSVTSIRVFEAGGMLLLVWCFGRFALRYFGNPLIGVLGGALACLVHAQLEFWHTGQPESFGAIVTAVALVATAWQADRTAQRRWQALAVGALYGVAFALKPPLGGGAVVCAVYLARREHVRVACGEGSSELAAWRAAVQPLLLGALGSVSVLGALGLWFFARGAWADLSWTLFDFTPGYTKLGWHGASPVARLYFSSMEALWKFSAFPFIGALLVAALPPVHSREREGLCLLFGVAAMQLIGVVMQAKFFQYHYAAPLSLLSFVAGLGFYKLWIRAVAQGAGAIVAFFSMMGVVASLRTAIQDVPGTFWQRSAQRLAFLLRTGEFDSRSELDDALYRAADFNLEANRQVAQAVIELVPADARVFVWGFEPAIYWLSGRTAASRYIYNVPQRVEWEGQRARAQLLRELHELPELVVVQHNDVFAYVTGNPLDSNGALETFPELCGLLEQRYRLQRRVEDFDLYLRQDQPSDAGAASASPHGYVGAPTCLLAASGNVAEQ